MPKKVGKYKIPFDPLTGDLQDYPTKVYELLPEPTPDGKNYKFHDPEWKDNFVFKGTLKYNGFNRGRSAANFTFVDIETNIKYIMFMKDFDEIVSLLSNGQLEAFWTFVKRGQNYGVCYSREV